MRVTSFGETDVGCKREGNEDSILVDDEISLFAVADGMGGHLAGEVASALAIQIIQREIESRLPAIREALTAGSVADRNKAQGEVSKTIALASKEVYARAQADKTHAGMGTTVALVLVVGAEAIVAHAGDSRVYLHRDGQCNQLTEDHTMLQDHLRHGLITPEEAETATYGNVISRAVGIHPTVKADTLIIELMVGDDLIICSDGLSAYLKNGDISRRVARAEMKDTVQELIELAKNGGGHDNISVIDVRVTEVPSAAAPLNTADATEPTDAADTTDSGETEEKSHTPSDKLMALRAIFLFRHLSYKELVTILGILTVRSYQAGEDVVVEGELGDELFVVLTGAVAVKKEGKVLAVLKKAKHFGEMALMDKEPRSASVTAAEPSKLMVINRKDFMSLVQREPSIGVKLLWSFVQVLSQRLRDTSAKVSANK